MPKTKKKKTKVKEELLTQAAFAKLMDVSQSAVKQAVGSGRISLMRTGSGVYKIPWPKAKREWENTSKKKPPSSKTKDDDIGPNNYYAAQAKKESYVAKLRELEFKQKSGQYVDKEKVEKEAFKLARTVRDQILNVPNRISDEFAAETDRFKIHQKLTEELNKALTALADGCETEVA